MNIFPLSILGWSCYCSACRRTTTCGSSETVTAQDRRARSRFELNDLFKSIRESSAWFGLQRIQIKRLIRKSFQISKTTGDSIEVVTGEISMPSWERSFSEW